MSSYGEKELQAKLDILKEDTKKCQADYLAWKANCDNWKKSHANHPNRALFDQYNKDWQETDKKLQHSQKMAEQRMQKLEDEIFSRQSGRPATPPSFVPPPPVPPPNRWGGSSQPPPPPTPPPTSSSTPTLPNIDFNLLKSVVSATSSKKPDKDQKPEPEPELPAGPKPNLLETGQLTSAKVFTIQKKLINILKATNRHAKSNATAQSWFNLAANQSQSSLNVRDSTN